MDINEVERPIEPPWYYQAACNGDNPEDWFPDDKEYRGGRPDGDRAKRVCNTLCTVRMECLAEALREEQGKKAKDRFGIRGGIDGKERARIGKRLAQYMRSR